MSFLPHRKHCIPITKKQLVIVVYSETHMKPINILCGLKVHFLICNLQYVVYTVTTNALRAVYYSPPNSPIRY
jgi:hypothetical protein